MIPLRSERLVLCLLLALAVVACTPATDPEDDGGAPPDAAHAGDGGLTPGDDDAGHTPPDDDDGGPNPPGDDAGPLPTDSGSPPGDAGDAGPPEPDGGAPVDAGAPPSCDSGFVATSGVCAPDAPEPFRSRTEADVCARWEADYQTSYPEWEATNPGDACDPGVVPAAALDNALVRTNLYRWLAGADPVTLDEDRFETQQACAVLQHAMGGLNHNPPTGAPCYTAEGAAGAGSSNLAFGAGLAGSLDLYVSDNGVPSLGHRRWVLNPTATTTQFGHKSGWSCMYSFSMNGSGNPPFVAWPPPGFVPAAAARGAFSFSSTTYRPTDDTVVEIAVGDAAFTEVPHTRLPFGYGWGETLRFEPEGGAFAVWSAGTTVRVRIRNTTSGDVSWTTRFTGCGG